MKKLAATTLFLLLMNRAQAQKLEWTNPDGLAKNPAYSQMVKAGKLLSSRDRPALRPTERLLVRE